jgi:translation initiation factor 2B subunit (eIF-2B alpha/beta/delta family)
MKLNFDMSRKESESIQNALDRATTKGISEIHPIDQREYLLDTIAEKESLIADYKYQINELTKQQETSVGLQEIMNSPEKWIDAEGLSKEDLQKIIDEMKREAIKEYQEVQQLKKEVAQLEIIIPENPSLN